MRSGAGAAGGLTGAAALDDSAVAATEADAPPAPDERWTRAILLMTRPLKSGTVSASFTTSSQTAETRARVSQTEASRATSTRSTRRAIRTVRALERRLEAEVELARQREHLKQQQQQQQKRQRLLH